MKTKSLVSRSLLGLLCLATLACEPQASPEKDSAATQPDPAMAGVMVDSVNYLHDRGMKYTLYDISEGGKKPVGGSIVDPLGSGGAKECCINLPRTWHSGIKIRVEWQDSDYERTYPEILIKELELPRYDHPADVYVVFYPKHDVEVLVSPAEPGHPEWAGRIKETPWDLCVAEHGRKTCLRAIPKPGLTPDEQTKLCGYYHFHPEQFPDAADRCRKLADHCLQDYEDEETCSKIARTPRKSAEYEDCIKTIQSEDYCYRKFVETTR